jgi:hypothetical protein
MEHLEVFVQRLTATYFLIQAKILYPSNYTFSIPPNKSCSLFLTKHELKLLVRQVISQRIPVKGVRKAGNFARLNFDAGHNDCDLAGIHDLKPRFLRKILAQPIHVFNESTFPSGERVGKDEIEINLYNGYWCKVSPILFSMCVCVAISCQRL